VGNQGQNIGQNASYVSFPQIHEIRGDRVTEVGINILHGGGGIAILKESWDSLSIQWRWLFSATAGGGGKARV